MSSTDAITRAVQEGERMVLALECDSTVSQSFVSDGELVWYPRAHAEAIAAVDSLMTIKMRVEGSSPSYPCAFVTEGHTRGKLLPKARDVAHDALRSSCRCPTTRVTC